MATGSILNTTTWRESVFVDTARRSMDPFSAATYESWRLLRADWYHPSALPAELRERLVRSARMGAMVNRVRSRVSVEALRSHLQTLEVLPTLASLVWNDLQRREESLRQGGDDSLEPEIELLAGLMLAPANSRSARRMPDRDDIGRLIHDALRAHAFAGLEESAHHLSEGDRLEPRLRGAMRNVYLGVRGTAYIQHADEVARRLLGGGDGQWFLSRYGFEIEDVIALREASRARWRDRIDGLGARIDEETARLDLPARGAAFNTGWERGLADAMALRMDRLDEELPGIDPSRARAVLSMLSCDVNSSHAFPDVYAESPVVGRPWVRDGDRVLLVLPGRLDTELLGLFETELQRTMKGFGGRRARMVDEVTVELLASVLPGCEARVGLHYKTVEDGRSSRPEMDGLVLFDDVAIIVEGKGGQLSRPARRGDLQRFRSDLKCITKGWEQAVRDRRYLTSAAEVVFEDGAKTLVVPTAHIRRTYVVVPTLHPLLTWSTQLRDLVDAGILPVGAVPWIVAVTDLRVVCESLRRPAELIAYLDWREDLMAHNGNVVTDEIELLGAWLAGAAIPSTGTSDGAVLVVDMQAEFDDHHRALATGRPGRPPAKRVTGPAADLLDELERERPRGWLAQSVACLNTPYRELVAAEACAGVLARRLSNLSPVESAVVGDAEVVCYRDPMLHAGARHEPSSPAVRRLVFEASPVGVRLVAAHATGVTLPAHLVP